MDFRLARASLLFLGLFLGACAPHESEEPVVATAPGPRHLELRRVGVPYVPVEGRVYRSLPVLSDYGSWEVEGESSLIDAFPGLRAEAGRRTLALTGREDKLLGVRGPFEAGAFNRCLLRALVRGAGQLTLEAVGPEGPLGQPQVLELSASIDAQLLVLDLTPDFAPPGAMIEVLRLTISGQVGPVGIRDLELVTADPDSPPVIELSLIPGERAQVANGENTRLAWALASQQSLQGEFRPQAGERLRLSACLDPEATKTGASSAVEFFLRIHSKGYPRVIERVLSLEEAWQRVDVALEDHVGRDCLLELSVRSDDDAPAHALLESPTLVKPGIGAPTVLLITSDTHRGDHLALAPGAPELSTPVLDELMGRGVSFERAYSSSNITLPSHTALLTGRHPRDTGVISNTQGLGAAAATLAEEFQAAGWRTVASISARHLYEWGGTAQGFDRFDAPLTTQRAGERTIEALRRDLKDFAHEPLFVWLHLYDPHRPYDAPKDHGLAYVAALPEAQRALAEGTELLRAEYRGEISYVDSLVGGLLGKGRMMSATVAFTADHGENLGEHERAFDHMLLFPQVVHVPLIFAWPDIPPELRGLRVRRNTQHLGIGRTLLDLAGLVDSEFPGENLLADLPLPAGSDHSEEPLFAIGSDGQCASMTRGKWHLLLHLTENPDTRGALARALHQVELYDLEADPACGRDLVEEQQGLARELRLELVRWLGQVQDTGWAAAEVSGAEQVAMLEELGYAGGGQQDAGLVPNPRCDCEWCERMKR